MLINLSNHPVRAWKAVQKKSAMEEYGKIIDIEFPEINPNWSTNEIIKLSEKYYDIVSQKLKDNFIEHEKNAVHIMGELVFVFHLVNKLKNAGITCVASTSKRLVEERDEKKIVQFEFVKFRKY